MVTAKTMRRYDAIRFVQADLGNDMFTTRELFDHGHTIPGTWPPRMKACWKSIQNDNALGNLLSMHPDFERVDGGNWDGRVSVSQGVGDLGRVRSAMWVKR